MSNKYDFYINFYKINVNEKIPKLLHQNEQIQKNTKLFKVNNF